MARRPQPQRPLFDAGPRPSKLADFANVGERVWPTPVRLLEQGHDLLIYRNTDAVKGISPKQLEIFKRLARLGSDPCPQCGTLPDTGIQCLVCTGQEGVTFDRQIAVFDHMHNDERLRLAHPGEIPSFIGNWFHARAGRR